MKMLFRKKYLGIALGIVLVFVCIGYLIYNSTGDLAQKIVKRHLKEIALEKKEAVYIVSGNTAEETGYLAIQALDPKLKKDIPVLIKANIGGFLSLKTGDSGDNGIDGRITDPAFVRGIIKFLQEKGVKDIAIGEGCGTPDPEKVKQIYRVSGYEKLAAETNVKMLDLNYYNDGSKESLPVKFMCYKPKRLKDGIYASKKYLNYLENGIVISVPKMKTHRFSVTSLSMKNLMGVLMLDGTAKYLQMNKQMMHHEINSWFADKKVPGEDKKGEYLEFYQLFSERLSDIYVPLKPDYVIIDGFFAVEGDGFNNITLRNEKISFAGKNGIYVDWEATKFMGFIGSKELEHKFSFDTPLYLKEAFSRFYPGVNPENIKLVNVLEGKRAEKSVPFKLIPMVGK